MCFVWISEQTAIISPRRLMWVVNATPRPLYAQEEHPVPIVQEARWVPGTAWTNSENLATTAIRSPVRPARSQPLYRLGYP